MKIDKVIFSTSERFSVFWNVQARLWKTRLGIEPVCLFFGDRGKVDLSTEHGTVIEMPVMPQWPLLIQITWGKFYWTLHEPDTTWLIGDMDILPLQRDLFTDAIAAIPDDYYVHLNADGITQLSGTPYTWVGRTGSLVDQGHGTNLPGHYHCGKGRTLQAGLELDGSFEDQIRHIVQSGHYNGTRAFREADPIEQHNLWCAEELRSSRAIRRGIIADRIRFAGLPMRHGIDRIDGDRIESVACYDVEKLKAGRYVDLHCTHCLPFPDIYPADVCQQRWDAIETILKLAGMF